MKLNKENFIKQVKKLQENEYFVVEDREGNNTPIMRSRNIADMYIVGLWEMVNSVKVFPAPKSQEMDIENIEPYEDMYNYLIEECIEDEMNIISKIKNLEEERQKVK